MTEKELKVIVHEVAVDGLPPRQLCKQGRVAFIYDGALASGYPRQHLNKSDRGDGWHAEYVLTGSHDPICSGIFDKVTHWLEFPCPIWQIEWPHPLDEAEKAGLVLF